MMKNKLFSALLLPLLFFSCKGSVQKTVDKEEQTFIRKLGLLEDGETIEQFFGSNSFQHSGSFFTNRRIAYFYIDEDEREVVSARYNEIDSIVLTDKTKAVTYASYLTVYKKDQTNFAVYADLDSANLYAFFNAAEANLKKYH
jgi:hypothetical protein